MKRSSQVTLTIVAAVAVAACTRRYDPCQDRSFDATACADSIRGGGYYWNGSWVPMTYSQPYPYYYDAYRRRLSSGGAMVTAPPGSYARPAEGVAGHGAAPAGGVTRGGFGSIGAGHGAGA